MQRMHAQHRIATDRSVRPIGAGRSPADWPCAQLLHRVGVALVGQRFTSVAGQRAIRFGMNRGLLDWRRDDDPVLRLHTMSEKDAIIARLRAVLPDLRQRWPIRSLALFGSMARDEATAESDLDVLVDFDKPIDMFAFLALEDELAGLAGRRVDLVSRAALKRHIGQRILAEAVPL
jgi:predicted nucleotidyltransferase